MKKKVWVVGAGYMAEEYLKVLTKMEVVTLLVGNTHDKTSSLASKYNVSFKSGGYRNLDLRPDSDVMVILACPIETLGDAVRYFIQLGVKSILCEKPVSFSEKEIRDVIAVAKDHNSKISVAYNRRFYSSVAQGKKLIDEDGGIESLIFDFTEWESHYNAPTNSETLSKNWLVANSSHVIDLAFHFMGKPIDLQTLKVKKSDRIFIGHGTSERGIPFSYHSNWLSAGRWGVEILTPKRKIIFRPLEKLQFQLRNSMGIELVEPDKIDIEFKTGLFSMVQTFLNNQSEKLISIDEHLEHFKTYQRIQQNA